MGERPVSARFHPGKRMNVRPRFVKGRQGLRPGVCRWCRCTDDAACPQGCAWATQEQTICTACTPVEIAWNRLELAKLPNMHRAFFLGFLAGSDDGRAVGDCDENPYRSGGVTARYWERGHDAGGKW